MRCSIGPRWACAFFFGVVGVVYGAVVSRMPAIKAQTGMGDADVGFVLLCMGLGALSSFPLAGLTLSHVSCRLVQIAAAAVFSSGGTADQRNFQGIFRIPDQF